MTTSGDVDAARQQDREAAHADVVIGEHDRTRHGLGSSGSEDRADDVARPLADLLVDPDDVLPEESDAEEADSDEEEHDPEQREDPFHFGADDQASAARARSRGRTTGPVIASPTIENT